VVDERVLEELTGGGAFQIEKHEEALLGLALRNELVLVLDLGGDVFALHAKPICLFVVVGVFLEAFFAEPAVALEAVVVFGTGIGYSVAIVAAGHHCSFGIVSHEVVSHEAHHGVSLQAGLN
jgi:hypothetical protein